MGKEKDKRVISEKETLICEMSKCVNVVTAVLCEQEDVDM